MSVRTNGGPITRADLEAAFGRVVGDGEAAVQSALPTAALIGGAIALAVVTLVFLAGKRRGKRKSSVIEIRRL